MHAREAFRTEALSDSRRGCHRAPRGRARDPASRYWRCSRRLSSGSTLIAYVLPQALRDTAALLIGVGTVTLAIGAGTAWLVSLHDFPGRTLMLWLLPLPLAIPTYLAAYVYVDLFEPLGLVHRALATAMPLPGAIGWLPSLRSLPGAIVVIGIVLYPYVYLSARTMFQHPQRRFC